jgi:WRKY transcription factor 22
MKGCMARKLVERSPAKPGVLIVTYMAEHCHPVPTQLNALAGTTRHKSSSSGAAAAEDTATSSSSPRSHEQQQRPPPGRDGSTADAEDAARRGVDDGNDKSAVMALEFGAEEIAAGDDENELWPAGMDLDDLLAPVDDDFDFEHVVEDVDDAALGRRLSL